MAGKGQAETRERSAITYIGFLQSGVSEIHILQAGKILQKETAEDCIQKGAVRQKPIYFPPLESMFRRVSISDGLSWSFSR